MDPWALIVAAGRGERLLPATGGVAKQFLEWQGHPLYWASARVFGRCARIHGLVFVFPENALEDERCRVQRLAGDLGLPCRVVAGGARRQDSVRHGLDALPAEAGLVLIHDAARPFVSAVLAGQVLDALQAGAAGVIPVTPVTDTIKVVQDGVVRMTPDRASLAAVQTPQGFVVSTLREAHYRAEAEGWDVTDDAMLLERCGHEVRTVPGESGNIKITRAEDLSMLERGVPSVRMCVGYGYDVHRYIEPGAPKARPLRLGGVAIPAEGLAVQAHSDGDVLLHALMDALLGCLGEGDIGQLFPDSDPALDNVSSCVLLEAVLERARQRGLRIEHVDLTVVAQKPRISPHRETIRGNVARLLGLAAGHVCVKATTEEQLGFTGQGLGLKAVALVTASLPVA